MQHNYFVYILTNKNKTVLYVGVTNDIERRVDEHKKGLNSDSFTSKYNCYYLVYLERFQYIEHAIDFEKKVKGWSRKKKETLINDFNSNWEFLNGQVKSF